MTRNTIDFGIDLGTTNSVIAVMDGSEPRIIKSTLGEECVPSVVNVKEKNGKTMVSVGTRAKNLVLREGGNNAQVASTFKTNMGLADWHHQFRDAEGKWDAPALSAKVLEYLLESVQARLNERPRSAVITVPAAFTQNGYQATSKAGKLAGLEHVELLEEPVAAALAYGLNAKPDVQQDWLVYDLGGGTFDAALVHYEDGIFTVMDHEGAKHLGGSNFDDEIVTHCLFPHYPSELQTDKLRTVLRPWAEEAKIALGVEEFYPFAEDFLDYALPDTIIINRDEVARLGIRLFERTVKLCTELLERNDIEISQLERVILVGGQTQSPFLRQWLEERLGTQLDVSADPLTAIAHGAAIYASTRHNKVVSADEAHSASGRNGGADERQYEVQIYAPDTATDDAILVTGTIKTCSERELRADKLSVQMQRLDESGQLLWESDALVVDEEGRFFENVILRPGDNLFTVILSAKPEGRLNLINNRFCVRQQNVGVDKSKLARGIGVIDSEGRTIWFFKRGDHYPATETIVLYTAKTLKKGERGTMLNIPIVEGDEDLGELNTLSSYLQVRAEEIHYDIPAGTEIEVSMTIDESRCITVDGCFATYDIDAESVGGGDIGYERVKKDLDEIGRVVRAVERCGGQDEELGAVLDDIQWEQQVGMLEELVRRGSEKDPAPWQCAKEILVNIKRRLWLQKPRMEALINWGNHKAHCDKNMMKAKEIFDSMPDVPDAAKAGFDHLMDDYERVAEERDYQKLESIAYGDLPELFLGFAELRELVGQGGVHRPEKVRIAMDLLKGDTVKEISTLTDG